LPFYDGSVVCRFVNVTQDAPVYRFSGVFFFLIDLDFFIVYFFHIVKKIVLEKKSFIKLYKVTKIKGCRETIVHPILIAL
jgi:hypothetical protein